MSTERCRLPAIGRDGVGLVLIVDNMPDNLAVQHDALDEAGDTVLVATDGASALQRAAQAEPDIVTRTAVASVAMQRVRELKTG